MAMVRFIQIARYGGLIVADYDLADSVVRGLSAMALAAHPSTGRFLALAVGPRDLMADVARTVERREIDFGGYEDESIFLLVLDRDTGRPAGAGRVIDGGGRTLDEAPDLTGFHLSSIVRAHELYEGKIWDLASLAVLPDYRDTKVGSLLYRTFINACRRAGVRHVVAMVNQREHRELALLGVPFVPMAGSGPFAFRDDKNTSALYAAFEELEPSIAEQGERLGKIRSGYAGEISARGLRRLFVRRQAARVSVQVSTGEGLDEHIVLPGLERRSLLKRR
jgi:GNAT superfamily N-acetyltransferase